MRKETVFWGYLKRSFEVENIPGRIRRVEEKGRAGFPDTLMCVNGRTHFIELKHEKTRWASAYPKRSPFGLEGPQAIELHTWAEAGAPARLIVCFGPISRGYTTDDTTIAVWRGEKALDFFREDQRVDPPEPCRVFHGAFSWHAYLHHFG